MPEPTPHHPLSRRAALFACALAAACGPLLLTGCEKVLTDANLRHVRADMSTKEVESVLGYPSRVESPAPATSGTGLPVSRYVYAQGEREVTLTFVGDRLATGGVHGSFEATPDKPAEPHPANLSGPPDPEP